MAILVDSFRGSFPEFDDAAVYSDPEIQWWIDLGANLLSVARWGNLFDAGQSLFVAHNLVLQYSSTMAANNGQNPGQVEGPIASASVDKVSYSRNPGPAMDPKNGHWNLSTYGLRYIRLVNMIGAGPVYVGAPADQTGASIVPGSYGY